MDVNCSMLKIDCRSVLYLLIYFIIILMFSFLICESIFEESTKILKNAYPKKMIEFYVSGSSSQWINGSIQKTKPEYAFDQIDKRYDWCSNCGRSYDEHSFIIFSIKGKIMRISGYYLKSGCCGEDGCCCHDDGVPCCECCLYSWSLQISNDNTTWKTIHKVEKDDEMRRCKEKTYKFSEIYSAKYIRLIQDAACPGDPPCIALNKIEFSGNLEGDSFSLDDAVYENEDDDVSIIGHISKHHVH